MNKLDFRLLNNSIYEFTLYNGISIIGLPYYDGNDDYIVKQQNKDLKIKIDPNQIETYNDVFKQYNENTDTFQVDSEAIHSTLVILGAGASYDYTYHNKITKPPLTNQIFDDSYYLSLKIFIGVESIASIAAKSNDLEGFFQRQWEKVLNTYNPKLLSNILNFQFYLRVLFEKHSISPNLNKSNYSAFFQLLRDELIQKGQNHKALIVTFNYDTILEQTLQKTEGYSFQKIDDYVKQKDRYFLLFKPHGSWNWGCYFKEKYIEKIRTNHGALTPIEDILYLNKVSLGSINENLIPDISIMPFNEYENTFPQILIPYRTKDEFVMPKRHLEILKKTIHQVNKIIIIGWKGTEDKFNTLLKESLSKKEIEIFYVTAGDTSLENELKVILPKAKFTRFKPNSGQSGTFSEYIEYLSNANEKIISS